MIGLGHRHADAALLDRSLQLLLRDDPGRHASASSSSATSRNEARAWHKSGSRICARPFRISSPSTASTFTVEDGAFFVHARTVGLRQDDDAADDRRTRAADARAHPARWRGRHLPPRGAERDIAFVFQLFALYPHMNVAQNIGFPLKCQGMSRGEIRASVRETARLLRIEHICSRARSRSSRAATASAWRWAAPSCGGRRRSSWTSRLGALDAEFRHLMCGELRELHDRIEATTVYVTHDQLEAMSMADRIAVMNRGLIEQIGNAAGDLRSAGEHVRRRFHRLAADEFPALRGRA